MNTDEQKRWMLQWRKASSALATVRKEELAAMTDRGAAIAADALMQLPTPPLASNQNQATSGLVIQQNFFMRAP
jgi:hypothetical protein